MNERLRQLYENLRKGGYELPEYNIFAVDMADTTKAQKLYNTMKQDGYELPDSFEVFYTDVTPGSPIKASLQQEVSEIPSEEAFERDAPERGVMDYITSGVRGINRGFYGTAASVLQTLGAMDESLPGPKLNPNLHPNRVLELGNYLQKKTDEFNPRDPYINPTFQDVSQGLGQAAAMMVSGGRTATPAIAAPTATAVPSLLQTTGQAVKQVASQVTSAPGFVGGSMVAAPEWQTAKAAGVTDEEAMEVLVKNYFVGLSEGLPITAFLNRLNKASGNRLLNTIKASGTQGIHEAIQEGFQTYLTNQVAKGSYDPKRDPMFQVAQSMTVGGIVGGILGAGGGVSVSPERNFTAPDIMAKNQALIEVDQAIEDFSIGDEADIEQTKELDQIVEVTVQDSEAIQPIVEQVPQEQPVGSFEQSPEYVQADQKLRELGDLLRNITPETDITELMTQINESKQQRDNARISFEKGRPLKREASPIETDEYTLLKEKIKNLSRGARIGNIDAKKAIKGVGEEIRSIINKQGLPGRSVDQIMKRVTSVNFNNPIQVQRLFNYVDKVTTSANYTEKLDKAQELRKAVRDHISSLQVEQKTPLKQLVKIKPDDVDVEAHIKLLEEVNKSFKPVGKGFEPLPLDRITDYISSTASLREEETEKLINEATKGTSDQDKKLILLPFAQEAQLDLDNAEPTTEIQRQITSDLKTTKLDRLSPEQLRTYVKSAANISNNNTYGGVAQLAARTKAESQDYTVQAKELNKLASSVSREISTFSEFMNDLFGTNRSASQVYSKSGLADMHKQSAQVEEVSHNFREQIEQLGEKLDKQYGGKPLLTDVSNVMMSQWSELQQRTQDESDQEGFTRAKLNIEADLKAKQIYYPEQYALESKAWEPLSKALSLDEAKVIMETRFPKQYKMVEFITNEFRPLAASTVTTAEALYNKTVPKLVNYLPVKSTPVTEGTDEVVEETDMLLGRKDVPIKPAQGASSKNRMVYLPLDESGVATYVRDRDFVSNTLNAHKRTIYDIKVAPKVMEVREFLRSNNAKKVFTDTKNLNDMVYLFNKQVEYQRGLGGPSTEFAKMGSEIISGISKIGYTRALGGPSTIITQSLPTLSNTMVNLGGDMPILFRMIGSAAINKDFRTSTNTILKQFPIGQRLQRMGGIDMGEIVDMKSKGAVRKAIFDTMRPLRNASEKVRQIIMTPFAYGDAKPAEMAWLSYYTKSLKEQGVDISGYSNPEFWNNEASLQEAPERRLAAAYAEQMINTNLNPSQGEQFAPTLRANSLSGQLIKGGAFPLVSFKLNQAKRLSKNMVRLFSTSGEQQAEAARTVGAILAEILVYTMAAAWIAKPLINAPIEDVLREMFDIPAEDDEEKKAQTEKRQMLTNIARDITPWALNETASNFTLDYYNKFLYNIGDQDVVYDEWKKDNGLIIYDNKKPYEGYGIFSMGITPAVELAEDIDILYDDQLEEPNKFTGEPETIDFADNTDFVVFSGITNLLSALGIGIREVNSARGKLKRQLKRENKGSRSSTTNPFLPPLPPVAPPPPPNIN